MKTQPSYQFVKGRLTDTERAVVEQLWPRYKNVARIARQLNRHPSTINWTITSLGLRPPRCSKPIVYKRAGITVRRFTETEDAFLETCLCEGLKYAAILACWPAQFGYPRSQSSLRVRAVQLANLAEHAKPDPP